MRRSSIIASPPNKETSKTLAIWSLITGIWGFIPVINLGVIVPIIAIVLGRKALKAETTPDWDGKRLAKTGRVCGIIGLIVWGLIIGLIIVYYAVLLVIAIVMAVFYMIAMLGSMG